MNRVNIYATTGAWEEPVRVGHFDMARASRWSDRDPVTGHGSGGPGRGQAVCRTAGGKWVLERWTNWQGEQSFCEYITGAEAREWLLSHGEDEAVTRYLGPVPDEEDRRPGRPEIGGPVHVRLGELLGRVDAYAAEAGLSRADAVRTLIITGLGRGRL